jgi:hypothetical protein
MLGDDDRRPFVGLAGNQPKVTLPRLKRLIQFRFHRFTLGKHPSRPVVSQVIRHREQFAQLGHRAGSDMVVFPSNLLDFLLRDSDILKPKLIDGEP